MSIGVDGVSGKLKVAKESDADGVSGVGGADPS